MDFSLIKDLWNGAGSKKWVSGFLFALIVICAIATPLSFFDYSQLIVNYRSEPYPTPLSEPLNLLPDKGGSGEGIFKYTLSFGNKSYNDCIETKIKFNKGKYSGQEIKREWCRGTITSANMIVLDEYDLELDLVKDLDNQLIYIRHDKITISWYWVLIVLAILTILGSHFKRQKVKRDSDPISIPQKKKISVHRERRKKVK